MQVYTTLLVFASIFFFAYAQQSNNVIVKDLKLFCDNTEFFIKAVAYNPVPLGLANMSADGTGGTGYCSPLQTMWTEWKSACYDSDYFSGASGSPGAPSPSNGWFTNLWLRDFPIMKAMGTNTLRIYNSNPTTQAAATTYSNIFLTPYGKNHTSFMDMAQQYGFKIIYPLFGDQTYMTTAEPSDFKRYIKWQIDEIGNHPALLMFTLGNELPLNTDPNLVAMVNLYIGFARSYMLLRWNRVIPITSAVVDLPNSYDYLAATLDVEVFTTNAGYRGVSLTDLWTGNSVTKGFNTLSCQYNKPVLIGEIGWQDMNNDIMNSIPNWFNQIWMDTIRHIDNGCIGGVFFEYSDEPLKPELQQTMGVVSLQESVVNGVSSITQFAWNPDTAVLKPVYFYVSNGTDNEGNLANFNVDIFDLIGRAPYTLDTLPSSYMCTTNFTTQSCPTTSNYYDCSGHGVCDHFAGTCTCGTGWTGSDCSVGVCTDSCSGNGNCITTISPPICSCNSGNAGDSCGSLAVSNACPIGAGAGSACGDGNGICNNSTWTCACYPGWTGLGCTIPTSFVITTTSSTGSVNPSSTGSNPTSSTGSDASTTGDNQSGSTGSDQSSTGNADSTSTGNNQAGTSTGAIPADTTSTTGSRASVGTKSLPTIVVLLLASIALML